MLDPLQLTRDLVAINSVNPFTTYEVDGRVYGVGNEAEINAYLENLLQSLGFSTQRQIVQEATELVVDGRRISVPQRFNLLAQKGSGERALLFFGHSDTVDVKLGWQSNPFEAVSEVIHGRECLRGLGVNDMKGGIAALLAALSRVDLPGVRIKVAILVDEEFWSFGAVKLLESDFLDDVELAFVPEISDCAATPDIQWIGLGRLGRTEFEFEVFGQACHGADAFTSTEAINAVHQAVELEKRIIERCARIKRRIVAEAGELFNSAYISWHAGGRAILSVPDSARFVLDRSFLPGVAGETVVEELKALQEVVEQCFCDGLIDSRTRVNVRERKRPTPACQAYCFEDSHPKISPFLEILKRERIPFQCGIGRSVADENRIVQRGIPTVIVTPHGAASHTPQEWVDCQSLTRLSKILELFIRSSFF